VPAGQQQLQSLWQSRRFIFIHRAQIRWSIILLLFAYTAITVYDPNAHIPRPNRSLIYFGTCIIAGLRLARERQVNVRVIPTSVAIDESLDLAHEIFNRVFRKVPERIETK
jgi:hypothetical protein